jgi:predicted Zn-dependent protease
MKTLAERPEDATRTMSITDPGTTVGTVAYMSPEQARGQTLDSRTDLWSFGVMLYEMVTGARPFDGAITALTFEAILNRAPVPAHERNSKVTPELERIVDRLLEKDRETRYQSAAGVRADLKRVERDSGATVPVAVALPKPVAGQTASAQKLADEIAKQRPLDTLMNGLYLPVLRAAMELGRNQPEKAVEFLKPAAQYERGRDGFAIYLRGLAYLQARKGPEAEAEFQKRLDYKGIYQGPEYALSQVGLARAAKLAGDTAKAKKAYQDFFAVWKDADPDSPTLKEAKAEYAKLQ